jgi:hypothetical protein
MTRQRGAEGTWVAIVASEYFEQFVDALSEESMLLRSFDRAAARRARALDLYVVAVGRLERHTGEICLTGQTAGEVVRCHWADDQIDCAAPFTILGWKIEARVRKRCERPWMQFRR